MGGKTLGCEGWDGDFECLARVHVLAYLVVLPSVEELLFGAAEGVEGRGRNMLLCQQRMIPTTLCTTMTINNPTKQQTLTRTDKSSLPQRTEKALLSKPTSKSVSPSPKRWRFSNPCFYLHHPSRDRLLCRIHHQPSIAPTLLYPLPTASSHPLLALIIKKLTDYYPLYQLVYQTFVFLSRLRSRFSSSPLYPRTYCGYQRCCKRG